MSNETMERLDVVASKLKRSRNATAEDLIIEMLDLIEAPAEDRVMPPSIRQLDALGSTSGKFTG
tara:strand:+ start:1837 stop:2028 length:192 start_codon:yes stop_codon:yes gene_type:complete